LRRLVVPAAERCGVRENYAYLEASLERFPTGAAQQHLAEVAGFCHSQHRLLAGGQMGLLELVA
jgi:demethylmenaquinone methyltransferase/2-methoxy-6-polyprenyl-1,4-benzoquinol methylase